MDDPTIECLFDRLRSLRERAADADEVARALVARISSRLGSHDKSIRQSTLEKLWSKSSGAIQMLLSIFENSKDAPTIAYIASIFRETLCLKQGKSKKCSANNELSGNKKKENKKCFKENKSLLEKKANNLNRQQCVQVFVTLNGTQAVVRAVLANNSRREGVAGGEQLLSDLVWILASLATKDPKFATKVRMLGCVRILHYILKGHMTDNKFIFPLLIVIKQLTKNPITVSILIRDGIAVTYERALATLGCIPTVRLRLCLAGIAYMSKNKVCCMQIVKTGLCNVLLRVFDHWDRYQDRARLKICAHVLQTLLHLCNIKSGRRALCTKKHVQALHRFCMQCPDEPEFDKLLAQVCAVITLCLKHQELPVPPTSPATFNLTPILKGTRALWPCKDDDDYDNNSDDKSDDADFEDLFPDLEGATEFTDDTDDTDFQKDDAISKSGDSLQNSMWLNSAERDIDDLKKYSMYFKEFGPFNKQPRASKSRSNSRGSILDDLRNSQANTKSVSSSLLLPLSVSRESEHNPIQTKSNPSKLYESLSSTSTSSLKIHKDVSRFSSFEEVYTTLSSRVRSVIPFAKVAYPDLNGGHGLCKLEPLNVMERGACRAKLLSCVERAINPDSFQSEVVYDLDQICSLIGTSDKNGQKSVESQLLSNSDELDIRKSNSYPTRLAFESRFESGNLRKAIQIGPREYELILMPDVNSPKRHQWFYFEVRNMQQGRPYIFNIVNCEKSDSQFNFGMKPVLYSVKEAIFGRPGWVRAGSDICYYRNSYHYARQKHNKCYLTVTFNITFPHNNDVCYLAYHFPYTYSMLMTRIWQLSLSLPAHTHLRVEPLCYSLNNNEVPLLTVTAEDAQINPIAEREVIFLTARVHPGESNASWVMDGTLCRLLADTPDAAELRSKYVFKIVPMLNVEGVINGCHRCGLTNEDLNRRWCKPSPILHPSIYHTKGLMEYMARVWRRPPFLFCDYHGHSRKKNVFLYGCCAAESWCPRDRLLRDEPYKYLMLPALMHRDSPAFSLASCSFRVERERESTARVAVWRQLGVARSYTMEASFCGFDRGPFKGYHLNTKHLQNVGEDLCEALNGLDGAAGVDLQFIKDLNGNIIDISFKRKEVPSEGEPDSDVATGTDSVLRTDSEEDFD